MFSIGIDVGGTNTEIGLVNELGVCVERSSFKTQNYDSPSDYTEKISQSINQFKVNSKKILGVGIGAPNGNFHKGTIEDPPNLAWKGITPLASMIKDRIKKPVVLTNDANAAAIGEMMYGNAKEIKHFVIITLGTGLGSGIVVDGKLLYGHSGFAGEIGHTIVRDEGRDCGCGRKGCLETYASATGIVKTVHELLEKRHVSSVLKGKEEITSKQITEAALSGDSLALEAFDITGEILGKKLADSALYTSPEAFFFFGGLALAGDLIIEPTKRYMEKNILNIYKNKVQILKSGLKENDAAILGASALLINHISI